MWESGSCAFQIIRSRVHTTCIRDVCITPGHVTDKDECGCYLEGTRRRLSLKDFSSGPSPESAGIASIIYSRAVV